jgi:molybdopterin-containing oxidoreductase family membrane subunit
MVICNFVLPLAILANPKTRTILGCSIASLGVVVGMWLERFLIVVPSLTHKQLPYSWGTYSPTPVELTIMAATFAAMILLYALFAKFVPIIAIWELKAGLPARLAPSVLNEAELLNTRLGSQSLTHSMERES